ncbi:MAG: NADH:ubiquinone reductase (Na(+)-transporting) subunit A [Hyphomicrobiales bacterium]
MAMLRRDQVTEGLLTSGLWTALRARPYGRRADPDAPPAAIFVTAMDSNPLAAKAETIVDAYRSAFADGLTVISHLSDGKVYVCQAPRAGLPTGDRDNVLAVEFAGPHPAGLVGTHIHMLDPVSANKTVWHLDYQDVIAIGKLFTTGRLWVDRVVSLAGPPVQRPRLVQTRLGASTGDLVEGELQDAKCRVISGSILSGRRAVGREAYLGRYHNQISAVAEETVATGNDRPHTSFAKFTAYSARNTGRTPRRRFALTTAQRGGRAPMVPLGGYERVMPLDVLATPLLRALLVGDSDMAQALGCLELDEEDMALCAFVCPSKIDHGGLLRQMLDRIEKEG